MTWEAFLGELGLDTTHKFVEIRVDGAWAAPD